MAKKIILISTAIFLTILVAIKIFQFISTDGKLFFVEDPIDYFYNNVKLVDFEKYQCILLFQITPGRPRLENEFSIEKWIDCYVGEENQIFRGVIIFNQDSFELHTKQFQLESHIPDEISKDLNTVRYSQLSYVNDDYLVLKIMYNELVYIRTCDSNKVKENYINIEDCWYYAASR